MQYYLHVFQKIQESIDFYKNNSYKRLKNSFKRFYIMQILTLPFEEPFYIKLGSETVKVLTFTTSDPGIIKFGIDASRQVAIHREEIYESIKNQTAPPCLPENR